MPYAAGVGERGGCAAFGAYTMGYDGGGAVGGGDGGMGRERGRGMGGARTREERGAWTPCACVGLVYRAVRRRAGLCLC